MMTDSSQSTTPTYSPGKAPGEYRNSSAFAAIKNDGSVVTWGSNDFGGDSSAVADELNAEGTPAVTHVYSTEGAFAALRKDGSVVTWGNQNYGGVHRDSVENEIDGGGSPGVTQIFSTTRAFAALREDGSVVTWGRDKAYLDFHDDLYGGDSSAVADAINGNLAVTQIFSTERAFAALREDGSVVTWGDDRYGSDSSAVAGQLSSAVVEVSSTEKAFAALREDGSVVTWGAADYGGDSSVVSYDRSYSPSVSGEIDADDSPAVTQVFSTEKAFAALREDGSVVTWGAADHGGDSSVVGYRNGREYSSSVADKIDADGSPAVTQIFSTGKAFAALREDGSVVTWGRDENSNYLSDKYGGDSSAVADEIDADGSPPVIKIYSTGKAFAALREDGSVITWGESLDGGDSGPVANTIDADGTPGVVHIFSTDAAFAALREDGSVVTWGGGYGSGNGGDSRAVAGKINAIGSPAVEQVSTSSSAFAVLREDDSVVAWGNNSYGGDSTDVADELSANVSAIASPFDFETAEPPNEAPVASDDTATTTSGDAVTIDVLANDSDADDDGLSIQSPGNPANGTASITDTDELRYTPDAGFSGTDEFTYTLSDGDGGTDRASVSVTVTADDSAAPNAEPNIGWILRDTTPSTLEIQAGLFVDVLGDSSGTMFNVVEGAAVQGLNAGATVNLQETSDAFTFERDGTTLEIRDETGNIVAQIAGGTNNSTVRFADGSTELGVDFSAGELTFAGQSFGSGERVSGSAAGIELDGSDTSGRFFDTGPDEVDLDALGGTATSSVTQDAGADGFRFVDGVSAQSNTVISNYGADDNLVFEGVNADDVSVQSSAGGTSFEFNDGQGTVSQVELAGVTGFFFDVNSFNADANFGDVTFA